MHVSKNKSDSLMLKVYASKTLKELHSRMLALKKLQNLLRSKMLGLKSFKDKLILRWPEFKRLKNKLILAMDGLMKL